MSFEIENGVLKKYTGTERFITIPKGVKKIGKAAFWDISMLSQ